MPSHKLTGPKGKANSKERHDLYERASDKSGREIKATTACFGWR